MSSTASRPRPSRAPRRRGALLPTVVVLVALVVALVIASQVATEVFWFDQLGLAEVYTTRLLTQVALFVVGGLVMAVAVLLNLRLAYRTRPVYAPVDAEAANLDRYRESLEPLRRLLTIAIPVVLGLFAGSAAAGQWQTVQLFLNRQPFGAQDAEFGNDVGFYVFTLPLLGFLVSYLTAVVLLSGIGAAVTHYLYGGLRFAGRGPRTTPTARVQLSLLVAVLALLQGASYFLDRYGELTGSGRGFTGAGYTAVNVVIPARAILAVIAVLVAGLFVVTAIRGTWRLAAMGVAVMLVSAIVAAGILPYAWQQIRVTPNQQQLETPYIERAIDATRSAYALDQTQVTDYQATVEGERGALQEDAQTTANIRLLDPALVSPAFRQQQRQRQYYTFPDPLDVDRYTLDGSTEDTVIGVRELDLSGLPDNQRSWVNDHTVYTHGFGVVAAYGNQRQDDGSPAYLEGGLPPEGQLGDYEPRIYFGEDSPDFSIVGGDQGGEQQEFDYPTDAEGDGGVARTTFTGDGGPRVGGFLNRLLYAVKFQDQNILLSDAVDADSQILYDRDPRDRVQKVAPFLTLDGDPYPAVVDGRVKWVVDGYTTSDAYPYSDLQGLGETTIDSQTASSTSLTALPQRQVNYIRNSVKATVDAYSGEVTLYAWDPSDPILQAWEQIYPDLLTPVSEMSADLMSHVRYPDDLFKVQRSVLGTYHVTNPRVFYSGSDQWQVPNDPTSDTPVLQPPYYLTLQMPGQDSPAFSLTSTFIPSAGDDTASNILTGFVAADGDAGDQAGVKADTYGQIRLLQLPRNLVINGPGQVQNSFNAAPNVSTELNILSRGNSEVRLGNLLTLPVGGGLLYVQPVYVQSSGETSYPKLQRVLVSFGDEVGFAETLQSALDQVFGGDAGVQTGDAGQAGGEVTDSTPTAGDDEAPGIPTDAQAELQQALQDAQSAIDAGQQALAQNDFSAYGQAQQQLSDAIARALAADGQSSGSGSPTAPTATATPSPTATATPSPTATATPSPTAGG